MTEEEKFIDRAEALGVPLPSAVTMERLLADLHDHESKLMRLRHDVQRYIAGIK